MTKTIAICCSLTAALFIFAGLTDPAQAEVVAMNCGATIKTVAKANNPNWTTSSTAFVAVPGAAITINVPAGEQRCVKLRFSALARCPNTGVVNDECFIRMVDVGSNLAAPPVNGLSYAAEEGRFLVRSYEWIKILDAGSHILRPEAAVQNAATNFDIATWTFSVDVSEK